MGPEVGNNIYPCRNKILVVHNHFDLLHSFPDLFPYLLFLDNSILNNCLVSFKPFLLIGPCFQSHSLVALFLLILCPVSSACLTGWSRKVKRE